MDNKELQEFIVWLPNNIEDFKGKTPEEVANILNDMSKTEDGMSAIEGMIATFKESVMKYGLGDKIISLVNKIKGKKEPVVKGYEANDRYYEQVNDTDGSITQDIYRRKGFDGHTLVGPEIILTRRTISPDKQDTSIYTIIDRDVNKLYNSDGAGLKNKLNGEKFNSIFDKAFKTMQNGGTFNRQEFRDNKIASGVSYRDANGNLVRNRTDKGNLSAKIAKSKAVDGFEDRSFVDEFDRSDYRARKRALKTTNPDGYKVDFNTWNNDRYLNSGQKRDLTLGRPNYGYGHGDFDQDFSSYFNSEAPQVPRDNTSKKMDNIAHVITGLELLPAAAAAKGAARDFIDYIIRSGRNYMNSSPVRQTVFRGASSNNPVYRSSNGRVAGEHEISRFFGLKKGGKIK